MIAPLFITKLESRLVLIKQKVKSSGYPDIRGVPFISNRGEFIIGRNVKINSEAEANPIGGSTRAVFVVQSGAKLTIGDNSGISNSAIICWQNISIGKNVLIGGDCKIYDTDFHPIGLSDRLSGNKKAAKTNPVIIEDGVFIGMGSIILKGVTIGEKSIIGAGSVVTKNIPPGEIWGGNPACFIRKLTKEELK